MTDLGRALEALSGWPPSPDVDLPWLVHRLERRQARRRSVAAVVALAVVAGAIALAVKVLPSGTSGERSVLAPSTVSGLRLAWTGSVGQGPSAPVLGRGEVLVATSNGSVLAFDSGCAQHPCTPSWFGTSGGLPGHITASNGLVVESGRQVAAYPEGCAHAGRPCRPAWASRLSSFGHPYSAPAVAGGLVYVGAPDGRVLGFPLRCGVDGATCRPTWVGRTGSAAAASRPAVADGLLFVVSDRLYAFSTSCPHPRACPPVWSANVGPATGSNAPAAGDDTVVVATDRVYAFDAHCAARDGACVPSWSYTPPDDTPLSSPAISDGVALVGGSRVRAFSLACNAKAFWAKSSQTRSLHWIVARTHETCRPIWEGPISRTGAFSQPVTAQGMVFGSADRVYAFPHMCELACHPLWTSPALGAGTTTPAVGMDRLFVTTSLGTLYAFTLDRAAGS